MKETNRMIIIPLQYGICSKDNFIVSAASLITGYKTYSRETNDHDIVTAKEQIVTVSWWFLATAGKVSLNTLEVNSNTLGRSDMLLKQFNS